MDTSSPGNSFKLVNRRKFPNVRGNENVTKPASGNNDLKKKKNPQLKIELEKLMNGFIWHGCLWYQQTGLSLLKDVFQSVVPRGPWKVGQGLKHPLIPSTFHLAGFQYKLLLDKPFINFLPPTVCILLCECSCWFPWLCSTKKILDWHKFCSYGDLCVWERKSERKWPLFLMIFKTIPKSIAGRSSLSVLANSETTQPVDHFSPVARCCLGTVFRETSGLCTMRKLANSWLKKCDKFFFPFNSSSWSS